MTLSEQRKELGQGKDRVEGGMGLRGRADLLRQEIKKRVKTSSFIRVRLVAEAIRAERRN